MKRTLNCFLTLAISRPTLSSSASRLGPFVEIRLVHVCFHIKMEVKELELLNPEAKTQKKIQIFQNDRRALRCEWLATLLTAYRLECRI